MYVIWGIPGGIDVICCFMCKKLPNKANLNENWKSQIHTHIMYNWCKIHFYPTSLIKISINWFILLYLQKLYFTHYLRYFCIRWYFLLLYLYRKVWTDINLYIIWVVSKRNDIICYFVYKQIQNKANLDGNWRSQIPALIMYNWCQTSF